MESYYRDFYRARLELVAMIPEASRYFVLFAGWVADDHLFSWIPVTEQQKTHKMMMYTWFKTQLISKLGPAGINSSPYRLEHPSSYVQHVPMQNKANPIPIMSYIDEALNKIGGPLAIPMVASGKLDHVPEAVQLRLYADELQAVLFGQRIRPSDENTRMLYALYNHVLHGSSKNHVPFQGHCVESRCVCSSCRQHNPACGCVNCIENRKANLIASQIRHSLIHST